RLTPALLALVRPAGEMHDRAGCNECLGSARRLMRVNFVGRTQARKFCARRFEGSDHVGLALEVVICNGLNAAGLVDILCEGRSRCEIGQLAEICEKHFWPRADLGAETVRGVT